MRVKFGVISLLICLLLFGCARTATQIVTYGDEMVVEVTLRGTVETGASRYFLVLASVPEFKVPLPPPDLIESCPEFIEPGMTPLLGTPEAYYTNFFSSWSGYVVLDYSGYSLVKGPFVMGQPVTREAFAGLGEINNKISFNFELARVFGGSIPDTIYLDLVSVPWPAGSAKIPADHLTSTNVYISKAAGSTLTVVDEQNSALDPSLDILQCTVTIQ